MAIETLEDLLAPMTPAEFFRDYFGKAPVHIPGAADKFTDIMNWSELNGFMRQIELWTPENFKLVKNGNPAPPGVYCRPTPPSDMRTVMRPAWNLVQPQLQTGATIALYFVQSLNEGLRTATTTIEEALSGRVQMNIYCSWVMEQGLSPHFDTHDVLAMHIEGTKQWKVYDNPIDRPVAHDMFQGPARKKLDAQPRKVHIDPTLEPGSLLYIPRGWYHEALTRTPGCFHIAAGVHYPVGLDVLTEVWHRLSADPAFRDKIAASGQDGGEAALRKQLSEMAKAAQVVFKDPSLAERVAQVRDTFRTEKFPADLPDAVLGDGKSNIP